LRTEIQATDARIEHIAAMLGMHVSNASQVMSEAISKIDALGVRVAEAEAVIREALKWADWLRL
jgi:hypothetical protein